jgi:hypothetical protein
MENSNNTPNIARSPVASQTLYDAIGGAATFDRLVSRFYAGVESDPELRAVYPSRDLGPAREHLRLFLIQYWGGPGTAWSTPSRRTARPSAADPTLASPPPDGDSPWTDPAARDVRAPYGMSHAELSSNGGIYGA